MMFFSNPFASVAVAILAITAVAAPTTRGDNDGDSQCCSFGKLAPDRTFKEQLMNNYLAVWAGHLDLADKVWQPDIVLHTDRHPTGFDTFPIIVENRTALVDFVRFWRVGWDDFHFEMLDWFESEYYMAIRWVFKGTIGANFTLNPTNKKRGDLIQNNGTDFIKLDECTGRMKQLNIAQDSVELLWSLGVGNITIK